jgi:hypothetical protein
MDSRLKSKGEAGSVGMETTGVDEGVFAAWVASESKTSVYRLQEQVDNIVLGQKRDDSESLAKSTLKEMLISPVLSHLDLDGTKPTAWDMELVYFLRL